MFSLSILKFLISALAILAYTGAATAVPQKLRRSHDGALATTNAERLRLGQPPLPPRSIVTRTTLLSRGGGGGGGGGHPPQPQPSGGPSSSKKCIRVSQKNGGGHYGYISRDYINGKGTYKLSTDKDKCLKVKVPGSQGPFDLEIHGESGNSKYLGLATSAGSKFALPVKAQQSSNSIEDRNSNEDDTPYSQTEGWSKSGSDNILASWKTGQALNFAKTYIRTSDSSNQRRLFFAINNGFEGSYNDEQEVALTLVDD